MQPDESITLEIFNKTPGLQAYQNGPPFLASQLVCLMAFVAMGRSALKTFERN